MTGAIVVAGVGRKLREVIVATLEDEGVSVVDEEADVDSLLLRSDEMDLLVLGESAENPVRTAEQLARRKTKTDVLVVVSPERLAAVEQAFRFSPLISGDVRCVSSDRLDDITKNVRALARKVRQRSRFKRVLPRLQERLPPVASTERRSVYLDTLLDYAPLGVIVLDRTGRAIDVNPEAERFLLVAGTAALGRPMTELLPPVVRQNAERVMDDAKHAAGGSASSRLSWPSIDQELHVELIAVPFAQGPDSGTVLILRDVTADVYSERAEWELREQRAVSRALETQADELRRLNDELQQFAYVASHDLQEPLRKIASFSDLLSMESAESLGEQGRFYLERMRAAAMRMSDLISSLLRFSRAGNESLELRTIDLNEIVKHVRTDLSLRVEEAGADIQVDNLPVVEGDEGQIRQVFQNLIANAIKFRKPGEPAKIRVFAEENAATSDDGRTLHRITVSDEGIGFDDQYADRIFSPFQRLHTSEEYPGMGMGLAICYRIVERHGGRINVQSRPGEGTSFFVELPAAP